MTVPTLGPGKELSPVETRDEYAAATTRKLAEELADMEVRLQAELAFISGQIIDAPALVAPLTRAEDSVPQPSQAIPE